MNKEQVRELFEYRDDNLYWRERPAYNVDMSKPAGVVRPRGHREIKVKGKEYKAHRLIWLYVNGKFPDNQIDHIDGDPSNNRIENLRDVSHQENNKNQCKPCTNTSGHLGVSWNKNAEKWEARISVEGGVYKHLGHFNVLEDAVSARQAANIEHGYHENHGRD